jgi:heat shock protein HslJ
MLRVSALCFPLALLAACAGSGTQATDDAKSYRARGNEPSWLLELSAERMALVTDFGAKRTVAPRPAAQRTATYTRYAARAGAADLTATIFERICRDSMTGMPYPDAVEVVFGDRKFAGCGGEPVALLQGREWVVEDIDGERVIGGARPTIVFDAGGRVSGRGSCNRFTGAFTLTGEGLTIGSTAGTMMPCPPALMQQEDRFLAALESVRRFDVREDGALVLIGADRPTIVARR